MSSVFLCSNCGPSNQIISEIHIKNHHCNSITRLIDISKKEIKILYSCGSINNFDGEIIETLSCGYCGDTGVIQKIPELIMDSKILEKKINKKNLN